MRTNAFRAVHAFAVRARRGSALWPFVLTLGFAACARAPEPASEARSPVEDSARIAADRPERLVLPFALPAAGRVVIEHVAPARARLEIAPPPAEPGDPPPSGEATREDPAELKPPIARGMPQVPRAGRGGRVTFDVRVSEAGEVTDVELVETDADSLTIAAARRAAWDLRYHPAMLRGERVAVWCRQVFDVQRQR